MIARRRELWAGTIGLSLAAVSVLFAACGGASSPGVASSNGSSTSTTNPGGVAGSSGSPPTAAQLRAMVKFAQCVRAHGLSKFPDPPYSNGELNKLGFTKPALEKYENGSCHADALAAGAVESQGEIDQYIKMYLKMANCMRAHGIANFPDPNGKGQLNVSESVEYEAGYPAAAKVCGAPPRASRSFFEGASPT
ncbi:MAG: hypothetical protein WCF24_08080 [Acidimicrobiales bacterium]